MNTATNNNTPNFTRLFNSIKTEIPFNIEWKDGTGYLNGLMEENFQHLLSEGDLGITLKTVDDYGRRVIIIVPARNVNAVLFEQYDKSNDRIISNIGHVVKEHMGGDNWSDNQFPEIFELIQMILIKQANQARKQ